ncbi:MAG: carbohydrate kinase family protein [Pyrinomonadaceae bacterium]
MLEIKARYGCQIVGMTLGLRGALVYYDEIFIETQALQVPGGCRSTTGAGDAFHAGFIYGMLTDADIESSLKLGCATAALKCRGLGARQALPTKEELTSYLGHR